MQNYSCIHVHILFLQVLEEEGHDPETFIFSFGDTSSPKKKSVVEDAGCEDNVHGEYFNVCLLKSVVLFPLTVML